MIHASVTLLIVLFALLWVKELTQRRSRHAADVFMGPLLTRVGFDGDSLALLWTDEDGHKRQPGWFVSYSTYFALGEPITLFVDLSGAVRWASSEGFQTLITLPEEERHKREVEMVKRDIESFEERDQWLEEAEEPVEQVQSKGAAAD